MGIDVEGIFKQAEQYKKSDTQKVFEYFGYEFDRGGNMLVPLKLPDGSVRKVTSGAYKAIQNNEFDSYVPKNDDEKEIISGLTQQRRNAIVNIPVSNTKTITLKYGTAEDIDNYVDSLAGKGKYEKAKLLDEYIEGLNLDEKERAQARSYAGMKKLYFDAEENGLTGEYDSGTAWKKVAFGPVKGMMDVANWTTRHFLKDGFFGFFDGGQYNEQYEAAMKYYEENPDALGHALTSLGPNYGGPWNDYLSELALERASTPHEDTPKAIKWLAGATESAGEMAGSAGVAGMVAPVIQGASALLSPVTSAVGKAIGSTKIGSVAQKFVTATPSIATVTAKGLTGKVANAAISGLNKVSIASAAKFLNPFDNPATAVMGGVAADEKYYQLIKLGYDKDTARANAIFTGYVNAITEKMGYDGLDGAGSTLFKYGGKTLAGDATASALKNTGNVLKRYLSANISEGVEEIYATVFERAGDYFSKVGYVDENGKLQQRTWFGNEGVFDPNALVDSFMGGFIGGAVMGGVGTISSIANMNVKDVRAYAGDIKSITDKVNAEIVTTAEKAGVTNVNLPKAIDFGTAPVEEINTYYKNTVEAYSNLLSDPKVVAHDSAVIEKATAALPTTTATTATTASVELGDTFQDTKHGNTITVVDRNDTHTTVEINNGTGVETKVYTNEQADRLATSAQYQQTGSAISSVYSALTGGTVTAKQAEAIAANPAMRAAFERITGTKLTGTKAEQRAAIRNWASNQANVEALRLKKAGLTSAHAKVASLLENPVSKNIRTIARSEALSAAFEELTGVKLTGELDAKRAVIIANADLARNNFNSAMATDSFDAFRTTATQAESAPVESTDAVEGNDTSEAFRTDADGKIRFDQMDIDYTNKTMRKGTFRVRGEGTDVRTFNGHLRGKYGICKMTGTNNYAVCLLQSGHEIGRFKTLAEAKKVATYADDNISFNDVQYTVNESGKPVPVKTAELNAYLSDVKQAVKTKAYDAVTEDKTETSLKSSEENDILNESISNEEVTGDGVHEGRKVSEDGDEFNAGETSENSGRILQRRDRVDNSERGVSQTERSGHRTVEERQIHEVVDSDDFGKLSTTVINEITNKKNKELYEKYESDARWDEGYELSDMITYDMLTDENHELRDLFADNIAEYFNSNKDATHDITGAEVPSAVLEATKNSVVKNEHGQLIPVYHGTDTEFDSFTPGDVGIHFGSYAQAVARATDKKFKNPKYIKAYLNIENPLVIDEDFYGWDAFQIAQKLNGLGVLTHEQALSFLKSSNSTVQEDSARLRKLLEDKGYDGIVYTNDKESYAGKSYIVFGDSQIFRTEAVKTAKTDTTDKQTPDNRKSIEVEGKGMVDWNSLHPRQRMAVTFMEGLAKAANMNLVITSNAPVNGAYARGSDTLYLDIYAGTDPFSNADDLIIPIASHELTHWMETQAPALWNKLSNEVFTALETVDGISEADRIANEIERLKKSKLVKNPTADVARSEIVARACEDMLARSEQGKKLFNSLSKAEQKTFTAKVKDIIAKLKDWMSNMLSQYKSKSKEATALRKFDKKLNELSKLWDEVFVQAVEVSKSTPKTETVANEDWLNEYGVQFDEDSQSLSPTTLFSERTWTASEYVQDKETAINAIVKAVGVSRADAERYINNINSIARLIADDRARLDYDPNVDELASVLKHNKEYKWTVDMSTLCAKRLITTGTFDAIQKALPNTVFDSDDIVKLRSMMLERGYEVACGICYVESTRRELGPITANFIERYKLSQKTGQPITYVNSKGEAVELTKTKEQMETTADKSTNTFIADKDYTPTLAELNTTDIDIVKRDHPLVYEAYLQFMNARGQAKPKLLETRAEYKGEILKHFKSKSAVKSRNDAGGLRVQSFSDFEIAHLIDMMQITLDMSRVGLMSQAYTKVPAFAEVFGDTGIKINLSLIAKDSGLDENGNLIFDDVEGIPAEEAFRLREKYSKNVGTILVGKNYEHIKAALADPRIDFVIPFHKSFWKESLYDALGLTGYEDYTETQNEKPFDKNRKIKNFQPSEYWDYNKSGEENAQEYLRLCEEDNRRPKFPQFKGEPGYWKLLIDFKMYDNDGVGSPQTVVKPEYDMGAAHKIMSEYEGGHRSFPVAQDVVDDFVKEYKEKVDADDVLYSERIPEITDDEYTEMKNHFGVTGNFNVAGYMLKDGRMLDFSGKHWGDTTSKSRQVDHRDIQEVLPTEYNGSDSMVNMISNGNIRLMPETGGINLAVAPTKNQRAVLRRYIEFFKGEAVVDIDQVGGDTIKSFTYDKGTSADRILRDIDNYFKGGTRSELMRFHTAEDDVLYSEHDSEGNALTDAQQEFFKDSKVRDADGNLLVCYHGTDAAFDAFDYEFISRDNKLGYGFYFMAGKGLQYSYEHPLQVYLNIKNPLTDTSKKLSKESVLELCKKLGIEVDHHSDDYDLDVYERLSYSYTGETKTFLQEVVNILGADGILSADRNVAVAFAPGQIKLVTNPNPTATDDIRYSLADDGVPDLFEAWEEAVDVETEPTAPKSSGVKYNKAMASQQTAPENKWSTDGAKITPQPKKLSLVNKTLRGIAEFLGIPVKPLDSIASLSELVKDISDSFGLPVKSGKVKTKNALGIYKVLPEVIRTRMSNDLPTIVHELGHHFSKKYELEKSKNVDEAEKLVNSDWLKQYSDVEKPGELAAEFVRRYFKDPEDVTKTCPNLTADFLNSLDKNDAKSVARIAPQVNAYMSTEVDSLYQATIIDSKKAKWIDFAHNWLTKEGLRDTADTAYTKWIDGFHPIKQLVDFVEESTGKVSQGTKNAYKLATNSLNAHNISQFVLREKFRDLDGNIMSGKESFLECVKDIDLTNKTTQSNFSEYLKHKHSLEVLAKGKDVYANPEQSNVGRITKRMATLEKAYPQFKAAAQKLYDFQYNVLTEFAVKSGLMTQEQADFLHNEYPCYVPFYRYVKGGKGKSARSSLANQQSPIMRMKGSGLDTLDPLESIVKNTERIISAAIKHQTVDVLSAYADNVDGIGAFIERVPPDQVAKTVDITNLKEEFGKQLQTVVKTSNDFFAITDLLDTVFGDEVTGFDPVVNAKERIIKVQRGDESAYYQVHDEALFDAITTMSHKQISGLLKFVSNVMGKTNALITQFNPKFSVFNPFRDIFTAYKLGEVDNPVEFIKSYAKALKLLCTDNDRRAQFRAMGGGHSSSLSAELGAMAQSLKDLKMKDEGLVRRVVYSVTRHPIQSLTAFADFTESIPRFMVFMDAYEKTGDVQEAMYQADDITTNFKRRGSGVTAKFANGVFRFNNAALQGLDKTARTITDADGKRKLQITAKWLTESILIALLLNFFNRERDEEGYENLSSYVKNNFYNISIGDGKFISLPKARENGVINSLVERTIDTLCGEDDAFYDFGGYLASMLLPPMLPSTVKLDEIVPDMLNSTIVGPISDIAYNRDFKGAPIESDYEKDLVSSERYGEGTSKLAYALGQTKLAVNMDLSPKKIDHLLGSFGFLSSANKARFPVNDSRKDAWLGLRDSFIKDSAYSTDVINKVYDNRDLAKRDFDYEVSQNKATAESAIEYERTAVVSSYISGMNKAIKALPEDEQRRGRAYLVQTLNRWNYDNTESQTAMINNLDGVTLTDDDCILTDVPGSTLSWTVKGTTYTYQMTPQEYHEYVTDYLQLAETYRNRQSSKASNTDSYLSALLVTKSEVKKVLNKKYQSKYKSKATKSK